MNLEKIVKKVKAKYADNEQLEEIVSDLNDGSCIAYWADRFCKEDFSKNKKLAKKLFKVALEQEDADFSDIASNICNSDGYNDKVWATDIFKPALEKAEDFDDKISICTNIAQESCLDDKKWARKIVKELENNLVDLNQYNQLIWLIMKDIEDKEWAISLIKKATNKLFKTNDLFEFSSSASDIIDLANKVVDNEFLDDKEKAKKIFELVLRYNNVTDILDSTRDVKEIYEDSDENFASEYINKALDKVKECAQEGYYCDIYNFIKDDLENEDLAEEFKDEYDNEMRNDYENYGQCEEEYKEPIEIDSNASGYYKLELVGTGGEYALGYVKNQEAKDGLQSMIDNDEDIYPNNEIVSFYDCDVQLFHAYGPCESDELSVSLSVFSDEDCEDEIEEIISDEEADLLNLNFFPWSTPYPSDKQEELEDGDLIFGGYSIEKDMHFSVIIYIEENEKFDINNIYIGTINMEESLKTTDAVIAKVLYIRDNVAKKLLKLYDSDLDENEELGDYLSDIVDEYETNSDIKKVIDSVTCKFPEIIGESESEYYFTIIRDSKEEVLYEREI